MLSRRSWLKRFGAIVATVALAPEIAFGAKLKLPTQSPEHPGLYELIDAFYEVVKARSRAGYREIDIFTDRQTAERFHARFNQRP